MGDKSITKISSATAPRGARGQKYLASGVQLSMRFWEQEEPGEPKPVSAQEYETAGFVIDGKAECNSKARRCCWRRANSWIVPKASRHTYKNLETFLPPANHHVEIPSRERDDGCRNAGRNGCKGSGLDRDRRRRTKRIAVVTLSNHFFSP